MRINEWRGTANGKTRESSKPRVVTDNTVTLETLHQSADLVLSKTPTWQAPNQRQEVCCAGKQAICAD